MGFSLRRPIGLANRPPAARHGKDDAVDVSHFAAICGMERKEFLLGMVETLKGGRVASLLKEAAQEDFLTWFADRAGRGDKKALLLLRLSLNRERDVGLFCILNLESLERFPLIEIDDMVPGFCGHPPAGTEELSGFEVSFCDLETALVGEERCLKTRV
jgi:hypothetical protein